MDLSENWTENWADMDSDTESFEPETCPPLRAPERQQQPMQQVMMPMGFVFVPMAHPNMVWGCQSATRASVKVAPPPGNFAMSPVEVQKNAERTTVVLRNLPSHLSRSELSQILDKDGFASRYDFLYLPTNFRSMTVFGYAIVNFTDPAGAQAALDCFRGKMVDGQAMITEWSKSQQGYDDLVQRYRDSPVMHTLVPDKHKPIILSHGIMQAFPQPTEPLQLPRKFATTQDGRRGNILH